MTATMTAPAGISTRAMLADLTISSWSGRKYDRKVSDDVATQHNATSDAGRYNKRLIARKAQEDLERIARTAFRYHYFVTLPWLDSGVRVFPSALYFDYVTKMNASERAFNEAADRFAAAYPQMITDAQRDLNGLFNASDYPAPSAIRSKFAFRIAMLPLPDATDFRVDLGDEQVKKLQEQFVQTRDALFNRAIGEVVGRIQEVVGRMAERLRAYKVTDDKTEGVFRDTLVTNIRDLVAVLPALNVTEDDRLDDLIDRVRTSLCAHDADVLRENTTVRIETADAADEILAHVNAFFA